MKKIYSLLILVIISSSLNLLGQSKVVQIKDILKDPTGLLQEEIQVTGLVIQYVEATEQTTSHYYLKDDYGAIIKVHTAESKPETNVKYKVTGILYMDASTSSPFLSEKSKSRIDDVVTPPPPPPLPVKTWWEENWLLAVIIGSGILLVILISILLGSRKKSQPVPPIQTGVKQSVPGPEKPDSPIQRDNLKTMVIPSSVPKTMKFIPGELEVITGDDKGKIIKIGGYPTEEGSIVTIGRDQVTGPRDFAHIQLKERTISRRQAEIILKDGKLYIKNLSETNYTKLDGKDLPPNTSAELKGGSVITFGEVEMKYKA